MTNLSGPAAVLLALSLSVTSLFALPTAAQADTGKMRLCRMSDWDNGGSKVFRRIALKHTAFTMTHAERRRIPKGVGFSRQVTMAKQSVVTASIKATATVKADAGAFFAKASVEAGLEVAGSGSKTTSSSVTETFTVPKAKRDRLFVFYTGVDTFRFRVHKRVCSQGQHDYYGRLTSFNEIKESGAVLCPHSRYRKGSISYQVALKAGC
jgi:hypothetical protein